MKLTQALDYVGDELIAEAAEEVKIPKHRTWVKWGSVAACLLLLLGATGVILPRLLTDPITVGGIERNYKKGFTSASETALVWPWNYKPIYEQYTSLAFDGREYYGRGRAVSADLVGDELGTGRGQGHDIYEDKTHTADFSVYKLKGVSEERQVAVLMEDSYYVFANRDAGIPATLGELLRELDLPNTLPLSGFSVREDGDSEGYFITDRGNDIWQLLAELEQTPALTDELAMNSYHPDDYITFTATSEALGLYKRAFNISAEGYVWTNICDYQASYYIGPEAAEAIIATARQDAAESEQAPYQQKLYGTITEIGEGYFLLDDSAICLNPRDGMVYRIMLDDIRIRRCFEFSGSRMQVGSLVAITFEGDIVLEEGNTVRGAIGIHRGYLIEGGMAIPE